MTSENGFTESDKKRILRDHLQLGPSKPVSYLPIGTLEKVLALTTDEYESLIVSSGGEALTLSSKDCCIKSGAVYAFSVKDLEPILLENADILFRHDWPVSPVEFIRRIAAVWLDGNDPILPIVRKAFGDASNQG